VVCHLSQEKKSHEKKRTKRKGKLTKTSRRLSDAPCWENERFHKALDLIRKEAAELDKPPEVIGVGFGPKRRMGKGLNTPVAKIYVKWMSLAKAKRLKLPSKIAGFEVVVLPTRAKIASSCINVNDSFGVLRPGCLIGAINSCGTLGMKLWDKEGPLPPDESVYFLTAYHVLPGIHVEVYQPGSPTPPIATDELIGETVQAINWNDPRSNGEFEVALVKFNKTRVFNQSPHAPAYPYEPLWGSELHIESAANLVVEGTTINHGWGFYVDVITSMIISGRAMNTLMVIAPPYFADDLWVAPGASGGVFYDIYGVPVSIAYGWIEMIEPGGTYIGALASFLNRIGGPDILNILGVTNTGPPGVTIDNNGW
jgi:hypothetical protein